MRNTDLQIELTQRAVAALIAAEGGPVGQVAAILAVQQAHSAAGLCMPNAREVFGLISRSGFERETVLGRCVVRAAQSPAPPEAAPFETPAPQLETGPAIPLGPGARDPGALALRVFVCSPFRGRIAAEREEAIRYARRAVADSFARGEAPFAPHLIYPQPGILDDSDPAERARGIAAARAWLAASHLVAVYVDHGISEGMAKEIALAQGLGLCVERRRLGDGGRAC